MDKNDPFYEETRVKLLDLKEISGCRYLYSMAPVEGTVWRFIIDGSAPPEDAENFSPLGLEEDTADYDDVFAMVWDTKKAGYSRIEYLEPYGWILSIYAPIWNSAGQAVGIVGCDFGAEDLLETIKTNILGQVIVVLISTALGLVLVILFLEMIFSRFTRINSTLDKTLEEITAGEEDLRRWIKVQRKETETKELFYFFNNTMNKIRTLVLSTQKQAMNVFDTGAKPVSGKKR